MVSNAALYIRLSKEDKNESINNQKNILLNYAKEEKIENIKIYIDDGFTGTNFNRPAFKEMIKDIKNGKINIVIVKDLSRLGRDYIKTGELIEHFFPINNIRFIAVTDNIDSFIDNTNNEFIPFKAIINDLYARDLSKKIRTAIKAMQINGLWTGGCLPLGYKKDPTNKNKICIATDEVNIVRKIFNYYYKYRDLDKVCNLLNKEKIPTFNKLRHNKDTCWSKTSIKKILQNPIYAGDLVQNKYGRLSYKYRKIINNSKEDWIINTNNHEAIITRNKFNTIQKQLAKKITRKHTPTLLDGLLYCHECKHHLGIRHNKLDNKNYLCCNYYRANYKEKLCTAHAFNYDTLEKDIINIFKSHNLTNINREIIEQLINKIEIDKNKRVTIFFNFKNIT